LLQSLLKNLSKNSFLKSFITLENKLLRRSIYMFCSKCGKEIKEDSKFCPNCGSNINNFSVQNEANKKADVIYPQPTEALVLDVIGILVLGFTIYFASESKNFADNYSLILGIFGTFIMICSFFLFNTHKKKTPLYGLGYFGYVCCCIVLILVICFICFVLSLL